MNVCVREEEEKREIERENKKEKASEWAREIEAGREGEPLRGPVSVSLQFRAVVRQCTRPFAYESGSEERTEGPEACMWRPWYEDKQSLAIMQIPLRWRDVLKKEGEREGEREHEKERSDGSVSRRSGQADKPG